MTFKSVRVDSQVYDRLTKERKENGHHAMNDVLRQIFNMPEWQGDRRGQWRKKRKKKKTT